MKIALITVGILHGYVGIRFGQTHFLIGGFCAFIHVQTFVTYCGPFRKAYRLIELQRQVKRALLAVSYRCRRGDVRKEIQKAVKALHCTGLRVGSFHEMERNSALVFINYVESQLVGLLVTF